MKNPVKEWRNRQAQARQDEIGKAVATANQPLEAGISGLADAQRASTTKIVDTMEALPGKIAEEVKKVSQPPPVPAPTKISWGHTVLMGAGLVAILVLTAIAGIGGIRSLLDNSSSPDDRAEAEITQLTAELESAKADLLAEREALRRAAEKTAKAEQALAESTNKVASLERKLEPEVVDLAVRTRSEPPVPASVPFKKRYHNSLGTFIYTPRIILGGREMNYRGGVVAPDWDIEVVSGGVLTTNEFRWATIEISIESVGAAYNPELKPEKAWALVPVGAITL